jgi:hypothetical protein
MKELSIDIDDDLYFYLELLERTLFIKSKEDAVKKSLTLFKDLGMHDWMPNLYRIGSSRVIIMERGMLLDIFELLTEHETYRAGTLTAMKRKVLKPEFRDINLTKSANWMIETMFKVEMIEHQTKVEGLVVLIAGEKKLDAWR